jgi:hypothetical protein
MTPLPLNTPAVAELTVNAGSVVALGAGSGVTGASALALPSREPDLPTVMGDIGPQTSNDALATLSPSVTSDGVTSIGDLLGTPPPIQPSVVLIGRPAEPASEQSAVVEQPKSNPEPSRMLENNPAYPDVFVLPAPNTGEHSSFGTLQLR